GGGSRGRERCSAGSCLGAVGGVVVGRLLGVVEGEALGVLPLLLRQREGVGDDEDEGGEEGDEAHLGEVAGLERADGFFHHGRCPSGVVKGPGWVPSIVCSTSAASCASRASSAGGGSVMVPRRWR